MTTAQGNPDWQNRGVQDVRTVLIVDDSLDDQFAIRRSLLKHSGLDLQFQEASSIEKARELLSVRYPDVMILDYYLGGDSSGAEFLQSLHDEHGLLPCPVVVVTGAMGSEQVAIDVLDAGAHDYIEKPRLGDPTLWRAVMYARSRHRIGRDLTLKAAELTRLNEELLRKSQLKTEFLANATHELRTPLSAIVGLVDLINHETDPKKVVEYVKSIAHCSESLSLSINDVLDLTKIEAGEFCLETHLFCPLELMREVHGTLLHLATRKNLQLLKELPAREVPFLIGDSRRLKQILMNFLGNAIKYTSNGRVVLRLLIENEYEEMVSCRFEVEDTGTGIPASDIPKVFERHFQATNSGGQANGTGLGLAIVKELTTQMQGRVDCQSELGVGSTFGLEVALPRAVEETGRVELRKVLTEVRAQVLVAEDSPVLAQVLKLQLQRLGCEPTMVLNGLQAIEAFQQNDFDLVILDARMPGLGGLEVSLRIRDEFKSEVPIVLLTADSILSQKDLASYGITAAFAKPISEEELKTKVLVLTQDGDPQERARTALAARQRRSQSVHS